MGTMFSKATKPRWHYSSRKTLNLFFTKLIFLLIKLIWLLNILKLHLMHQLNGILQSLHFFLFITQRNSWNFKFAKYWTLKATRFFRNVKTSWISIFLWWNRYIPNSIASLAKCIVKVKWMKLHWKPWMIYVTLNSLLGYFTFVYDFVHSIKLTQ
jgi:hypothetical protein